MSLDDYYNKLTGLFDELSRLKPPHHCSCGHCTCDVAGRFKIDWDEEKLHQFLVGVYDDLYEIVQSNLLSRVPAPSLDEAFSVLSQDEHSKSLARSTTKSVE
ncbi:hypothetical protein LIER_27131 [Lithospermum erythrorhizon]|uniref:Uncharacterized protein n=1 Tax=Lithospermum erythrorhizon TaxID=34254 RepID=A0AAV3RAX6_LITER